MFDDKQLSIVFSKAPTLIRLGFLSVNRQHIPKYFALVSFLLSNLQTIELLLNNASLCLNEPSDKGSTIIEAYLQLFSFSHRFSYTNRTPIFIWAGIMLAYCLHFLILFFYLSVKLKTRSVIPDYIQQYWSIMNYFHPLILFYPIHTFNLRVIHAYRLGTFRDPISGPVMILFYVNVIINFLLAFGSTRFFYVVIKTKDLLSCKNNSIRTNDILSKTFISVLWIFSEDSDFIPVFTLVVALLDCFLRDFALFYYLPYHSIQVLEISALIQGATTVLSLATLTAKILSSPKLDLDQFFVHVAWIIVIPFGAKLYHVFLRRLFDFIVSADESKISIHYALLQMSLFSNLSKEKIPPNSDTRIFNLPYMIYKALISQIEAHEDYAEINFKGGKAEILKLIRGFYVWIVAQNPKSHVAKLTLAYHYVKKESAYLLANNLIEDVLNDAPSFSILVSLSLIRFELQKKNFLEYSQKGESTNQSLNLLHYVQVNSLNDQLKKQVKHQIRKQLEFWENFSSNKPDMGTLTELATTIDQEKKDVHKIWEELAKTRPSTFYSPPLVYGMYISLANNDAVEGEKFLKDYHTEIQKTKRLMEVDDLNNDTMMAEDTVQISMSGSRTKIGYILDCSSNISEVYGWKKEFLTKQPIITIMPPYYQHKHDRFLMNHYNTGKTKLLNNTSLLPVVGSDGYIRPSRVHIKMHPFVEQGISYVAVLRAIQEPKRMVLIRRDGTIDGMSKNFAVDMNILSKKSMNIFNLCPEFRSINSVFNKKALKIIEENSPQLIESDSSMLSRNRAEDFVDFAENPRSNDNNESSSYNFSQKRGKSISEKSPINSMEIETQAQAIYDSFTTGSKLTFYPQTTHVVNGNKIKLFANKKASEPPFRPIFYNVQITTRIHGKEFIKVVYLDRIITENDDNPSSDDHKQPMRILSPHKQADLLAAVSSSRPLMSPSSQEPGIIKIDIAENTDSDNNNTSRIMTIPEEFINNESIMKTPEIIIPSKKSKFAVSPKANKESSGIIRDRPKSLIKSEEHGTEPHQEENLLRKKLNKLKNKLDHQLAMEIHRQEGSVASSYLSRGKKMQGLILRALNMRTYKKSAIMFCLGFFLFVLAVLILQTFESLNILTTFNNVTSKTDVIGNGVFRLNAIIYLALYARVFYVFLDLRDVQNLKVATSEELASDLEYFTNYANQFNSLLLQQVSQIDPEYQKVFYQKDIRMYENSSLIGYYSNFEATTLLLGRVTRFLIQQTSSNYTGTDLTHLEFFLNNTFNDFLVSSETTTALLITNLNDTMHDTDRDTLIIYVFIIASSVVFLAHVLRYFHIVMKDSNRFIEAFFRLSLQDAREIKSTLQNFINSLDSNIHDLEDIQEKRDPKDLAKNENNTTGKIKFRRPSTDGLLKKQILAFMRLLPIYIILIGWTLGYFLITKNILTQIKQQEAQISNSLSTLYRQNLLITESVELIATNSTAYVRNKPIEESMLSDLESIKNIVYIIDQFRDSNGDLTTREQAVFFDFPCSDFAYYLDDISETIISSCIALSGGAERISFTGVNSQLYTSISTYYYQFLESSRTTEDLNENIESTTTEFQYLALVAPAMCQILYDSTIEDFETQVDNARLTAVYFSIFMIVGMGISAIIVWIFVIKKIVDLEIYYKMMLKLVPVPSILANQHLKQYLIRNSNNLLDSVRSFL